MKHFFLFLCAVLFSTFAITGCSKDSDTPTDGNSPATSGGSVSAKVNGTAWKATTVQGTWTNGVLGFVGAQIIGNENQQINISGMVAAAGTYSLNPLSGSMLVATYSKGTGAGASTHTALSGTLVVSSLDASGAKGTFSFKAGIYSVTDGSFDIKFK